MAAPSLTQHFGVPIDEMSPLFYGCLGAAIWLVYLFCRKQFAERIVTGDNDYIYQLLPRQLATHEEYAKGFMIYFVSIAALVVLLALLGPENMKSLGITLPAGLTYVTLPPAIALILMGALPNVPGLTLIKSRLREYAHARAFIPDSARATAQRLAAADFDFNSYRAELSSPELRGVEASDFTRPRNSLEHAWARLCCLVFMQKTCRMSGLTDSLDAGLLQQYEKDLELIESRKMSMEAEMAAYRFAKASDSFYTNNSLRRAARDNLYKLYILLGCSVRLKKPHDDIDLALGQFGFKLNRTARAQDMSDVKLVGLAVVAASVLLLGLAAAGLGQFGLWTMSPVYPQTMFQPLVDAASTLVPHATALMIADMMRRRAITKGAWYRTGGAQRRANGANYVRVALVSGIAGYVALILWGFTQQIPTLDGLKIDAPNALLGMVTGGFYVYHLDNAETGRRPSRVWELGAQSAATGLCGLLAACAAWQIIFGSASEAIDRIVLTTAINAAVGFAFGWYVPRAAAAAQYDPLAEASAERVRTLQAAARARLGDTAATAWIDKPHPSLASKAPRAAAATDVDGLERAVSLLHGPQALVAQEQALVA